MHRYKLQQLKMLGERAAEDGDRQEKDLRSAMKVERQKIRHHKGARKASGIENGEAQPAWTAHTRKSWESLKNRLGLLARE
jgi:hypothetical protein